MITRRPIALVLTTLLVASLAAGCSDEDEGGPDGNTDTVAWPLTGLDGYPQGDTRQAVTVKIENTAAGQPQIGIGSADLVVQELVEGGLTRLAVMFHSQQPDAAAPVRSMRETDIGLVLPTAGTLAASGGSGSTLAAVDAAGLPTAVEGDPGFSRDGSRKSPYNVMLDVAELSATLPPSPPTVQYLPFGDVAEGATSTPAAKLDMRWPAAESEFTYDAATSAWVKTDIEDSADFSFTNVIALTLPLRFDGGTDAAGTPIPTMVTTGSGQGVIATGDRVYDVTWSKASNSAPWAFTFQSSDGEGGQAFTVPPGRSWIALLPEDGGSVKATPPASPAPTASE